MLFGQQKSGSLRNGEKRKPENLYLPIDTVGFSW
jgi:hypothetical protein